MTGRAPHRRTSGRRPIYAAGPLTRGLPMLLELTWRDRAACREDTAADFFAPPHFERKPEKDLREGRARALCTSCVVRDKCLDYALNVEETHGIWGGLNELERRRLMRRRAC